MNLCKKNWLLAKNFSSKLFFFQDGAGALKFDSKLEKFTKIIYWGVITACHLFPAVFPHRYSIKIIPNGKFFFSKKNIPFHSRLFFD